MPRPLTVLCLILAAVLGAAPGQAVPADAKTRVQAAFLYKFCDYIDWPNGTFAKADSPIVMGFIGNRALAGEVQAISRDRLIGGRQIKIRQLRNARNLRGIHLLYVSKDKLAGIDTRAALSGGSGILSVTDTPDAAVRGMINFVVADNRIQFDIDNTRSRGAGIRLDADLLGVARRVD